MAQFLLSPRSQVHPLDGERPVVLQEGNGGMSNGKMEAKEESNLVRREKDNVKGGGKGFKKDRKKRKRRRERTEKREIRSMREIEGQFVTGAQGRERRTASGLRSGMEKRASERNGERKRQKDRKREREREETMNGGVICNGISWQQ